MRLRNEREARCWSKSELARRAGLNHSTIGQIESGRFRPYDSQLLKLAKALGVPEAEAQSLLEEVVPPHAIAAFGTTLVGRGVIKKQGPPVPADGPLQAGSNCEEKT